MKKWTYLVAAVLMSGTAPFFTSCIDNDEPEGITILRKAKAELISARKAIVEAEAIRLKAEAALKDAEAEFKLAQAELERAKIKQMEAETEALKAKYEAEIQKLKAETEEIVKRTEAAVEQAVLAQQKALEELKQAEANATKAQWDALKPYKEAYEEASENYYTATKELLAKEEALANAEADKTVTVQERRNAEKRVRVAENKLADAVATLEGLNEEYTEKLPTLVPGEIPAKIEALEKEIAKLEQDIQLVEVEKQEAAENNPEYAKLAELKMALEELGDKDIDIAEFKNTINPDEAKYWYYEMDQVVLNASKYTLNDLAEYTHAMDVLTDFRNKALNYQLDEDDVKWNEALLNEAKAELEVSKKELVEKEALFTAAVKAYNEGKGVDVTAYIGYDKLVDAVAAYNTAADALDAQKAVVAEKEGLVDAAWDAFLAKDSENFLHTAHGVYQTAIDKAVAVRIDAIEKADKERESVLTPLQEKTQNAELAVALAEKEEALALAKLQAADKADEGYADLQAAYDKAVEARKAAVKDAQDALTALQNAITAENTKFENAQKVANAQLALDKQKAENNREKAIRDWENGLEPEYAAEVAGLKQAWEEAKANLQTAEEAMDKMSVYRALTAVNEAAWNMDVKAQGYTDNSVFVNEYNKATNSVETTSKCYDLDVTKLFVVTDAKEYLKTVSRTLYGTFGYDAMYDGEWPVERITPLDRAGIDAIIKKYMPEVAERNYHLYYDSFGYFGREVLGQEVDIEIAQSVIDNSEKFDALVASVEKAMAALSKSHEDAKDANKVAFEAVEAQQEVIEGIEAEFEDKISAIKVEKNIKDEILKAYASVNLTEEQKYTEESIKQIKREMEDAIEKAEDNRFDKETALLVAQDALENIAKPDATAIDNARFARDIAKLDRQEAQKAMERAEKELNDATAAIMGDDAE